MKTIRSDSKNQQFNFSSILLQGILLIILFATQLISKSDETKNQIIFNESLDYELDKNISDSAKIEILNKLVRKYLISDGKRSQHYAEKSLEIANKSKNPYLLAMTYNLLSLVSWACGKFSVSLDYSFKALRINDSLKNEKEMLRNYGNIGNVFSATQQYQKAIDYFNKALNIAKKNKMDADIAKTYGNIGIVYNEMGKNEMAMKYYDKALLICKKLKDTAGLIRNYSNIAVVQYSEKKYESALETNKITLELAEQIGDNRSKCLIMGNSGTILMKIAYDTSRTIDKNKKRQLLDQAVDYFQEAIQLSRKMNFQDSEMEYLDGVTKAYEGLGDYKQAYNYLIQFKQMEDSIFNIKNQSIIADIEASYEKEIKDKEIKILKKEKDLNRIYIIVAILLIAAGIVIIYVLHRNYLTTRKFNHQLESKNTELSETNATKDKLFTVLSHDLRNPLQTISLNSELLETFYAKMNDDERLHKISRITEISLSLNNLFEELLLWARSQSNKIEYNPVEFSLKELTDVVIKLLNEAAALKNIDIINQIDENLRAYADMSLVNTIFRNLISNSVKFTEKDGEIIISAQEKDEKNIICFVKDNGVGISSENIPKLLSITSTYTTRGTNNESGTGLGLILVNEFVKVNKGDLEIQSIEGKGTTISFTLPKFKLQ